MCIDPIFLSYPEALFSKRASVGDTIECDVRHPFPGTIRMMLTTTAATAYGNELLADPKSGWRLSSTGGVAEHFLDGNGATRTGIEAEAKPTADERLRQLADNRCIRQGMPDSGPEWTFNERGLRELAEALLNDAAGVQPTAPVLTDEQIDAIAAAQDDEGWFVSRLTKIEWRDFARDVLRAAGGVLGRVEGKAE